MRSILVALAALLFVCLIPSHASATGPQDYTYRFTPTNFYSNYSLQYEFDGLDTATEYTWTIQAVTTTGAFVATIAVFHSSGSATAAWSNNIWPALFTTPIIVVDNFGKVLAHHFLYPSIADSAFATIGTPSAAHDVFDKTAIRVNSNGLFPAANDVLTLTYHDPAQPWQVMAPTHTVNGFLLIHYILDPSVAADSDLIIRHLPDTLTVAIFNMQKLVDYQRRGALVDWASAPNTDYEFANFVVLTADGKLPTFADRTQSDAAFGTNPNPMKTTLAVGGYDYERMYTGGTKSGNEVPGESVFFVTNQNDSHDEWSIKPKQDGMIPAQPITMEVHRESQAIWQAYPDEYMLDTSLPSLDVAQGSLATAYHRILNVSYQGLTGYMPGTFIVSLIFKPNTLSFGQNPDDYRFFLGTSYVFLNTTAPNISQKFSNNVRDWGLNTEGGHLLLYGFAILVGMILSAAFGNYLAMYGMAYIVITLLAVMTGFLEIPANIIFGVLILPVAFFTLKRSTERSMG